MHQNANIQSIVDRGDFCRTCGGYGTLRMENGHGGYVADDCDRCRGTGARTVLLSPKTAATPAAMAAE